MNTYFERRSFFSTAACLFHCARIFTPLCFFHVYPGAVFDVYSGNPRDAQELWRHKVRPSAVSPIAIPSGEGVNSQHMLLAKKPGRPRAPTTRWPYQQNANLRCYTTVRQRKYVLSRKVLGAISDTRTTRTYRPVTYPRATPKGNHTRKTTPPDKLQPTLCFMVASAIASGAHGALLSQNPGLDPRRGGSWQPARR